MTAVVSAHTRVFAVLGSPVSHSLSPAMHRAAFDARQLDAVYVALECEERHLEGLMRGLAAAGGGGNVTLPHKERAAAVVDRQTVDAERTGACNTFAWEDGGLVGDNTDVAGFRAAAETLLDGPLRGRRVLLVGAGGAARAALTALVDDEAAEVVVVNRSSDRARRLVDRLGGTRSRAVDRFEACDGEAFDLVVQATRLGLDPADPLPVDLGRLGAVGAVLDLVYGAGPTALVGVARDRGVSAEDGREMLVQQGAAAFRSWWGDPVPVAAMRAALRPGPV